MDMIKHAIAPLWNVKFNSFNIACRIVNHVGYFKWINTKDVQINRKLLVMHQVDNNMLVQLPLIEKDVGRRYSTFIDINSYKKASRNLTKPQKI